MKPLAFGLGTLLCASLWAASQQNPAAVYREETRERGLAARISPPQERGPGPVKRVNLAQVRRDAEELAQLERTIQIEIREAERGAVPKDLGDKLKKIQKLSKRLRGELFL